MVHSKIREFARSPSVGIGIGLVSALLLGSLATAGLNTIWVSRLMIAASASVVSVYVGLSSSTSNLSRKYLLTAIAVILLAHVAFERAVSWFSATMQAQSHGMPQPPLLLLFPPGKLGYTHPKSTLSNIPVAVSYVERPTGGFAGFGRIGDNENDDVMFGIDNVAIQNLSPESISLSLTLVIDGEGKHFELPSDGKGRWERQLNKNDYFATTKKPRLSWILSPINLASYSETSIASRIGFVASQADEEDRKLILRGSLPPEYSAVLRITDLQTGHSADLKLPFGIKPKPADDPVSKMLRERTEGED